MIVHKRLWAINIATSLGLFVVVDILVSFCLVNFVIILNMEDKLQSNKLSYDELLQKYKDSEAIIKSLKHDVCSAKNAQVIALDAANKYRIEGKKLYEKCKAQ